MNITDVTEIIAEQTLLGQNGDNRLPLDGYGIRKESRQYLNFVIYGFSPMAKTMAIVAAQLCHFPNFDADKNVNRTVITIIDSDIKPRMKNFIAEYSNLFALSTYRYVTFDAVGKPVIKTFSPAKEYGDFLDIEWVFVDSDAVSPESRKYVESMVMDRKRMFAVSICLESQEDNIATALKLPDNLYDRTRNIPIYVHLFEQSDVFEEVSTSGRFGYIYGFGECLVSELDTVIKERINRGQRVNAVYEHLFYGRKWNDLCETDKLSSIYCANSIPVKQRSFGKDLFKNCYDVCATEHRRWVMVALLLGYSAYPEEERNEYKQRVFAEISKCGDKAGSVTWKWLKSQQKLTHRHIDIDAFDSLVDEEEKFKDLATIVNIPYILSETDVKILVSSRFPGFYQG